MSLLKRVIDEAGNRKLNIIVGTTTTMISGTVTGVGVGYNVTI